MIIAGIVFVLVSLALLVVEERLMHVVEGVPVTGWLAEHIYIPMLRVVSVLLFVTLAYPDIFGLDTPSTIGDIFVAGRGRFDDWLNAVLIVSFLLPAIPVVSRLPGIILTVQGVIACCLLFAWVAPVHGLENPVYWMGWTVFLRSILVTVIAAGLGYLLHRILENDPGKEKLSELVPEALRLAAQLPAITLYASALGAQIT